MGSDLSYALGLPPADAIAYFERKGYRISWDWHDTEAAAHAAAFTVAKANRLEVLQTIQGAMARSLKEGMTAREFAQNLTPQLQDLGWWGRQEMIDPKSGESRMVQLGSPRRLETIYRTNTQTAMMAGHYKQMLANAADRPYWQYIAVMDRRTRPAHAAMHGRVFRYDDPVWASIFPPNGFRCRCRVHALSAGDMQSAGLEAESSAGRLVQVEQTVGIDRATGEAILRSGTGLRYGDGGADKIFTPDPGWSYNPGQAAWQPELDRYAPEVARQYVQGSLTGPDFARFFAGKSGGEFPVAVLRPEDMDALGARAQTVWLSADSLVEHLNRHPEITLQDYRQIPDIVDKGEVYKQGDERLVFLAVGETTYRAALKRTANREKNYFLTLFKSDKRRAENQVQAKLERVR